MLDEIFEFCWSHRGKNGFKDWPKPLVAAYLAKELDRLLVVNDADGICGVCSYTVGNGYVYVHHILAIRDGLRKIVEYGRKNFPGHFYAGARHGVVNSFDFNRRSYGRFSTVNKTTD